MKLLVLDVEGTLFQTTTRLEGTEYNSTIWQEIASRLGPNAIHEEVETHKRWNNNAYKGYIEWMRDTIAIHIRYGLSQNMFFDIIDKAVYSSNVVETLLRVDRSKYELLLISGGFRELAARAQKDIGIHHCFAASEYIFDEKGTLASYNLLPCDFEGKIDFIKLMLREYKLGENDWLFIGDGANDVPIARYSPISIGFQPHPKLKDVSTYNIEDFKELFDILNLDLTCHGG